LTFAPPYDLKEFNIVSRSPQLRVEAPGFAPGLTAMLQQSDFTGVLNSVPLGKGQEIVVTVSGLPVGRGPYWVLGWTFLAIFLMMGLVGAWKSLHEVKGQPESQLLLE
jgi:hypothetical protein